MNNKQRFRKIIYIYLCIVPLIVFILAFAVGHVEPYLYVPVWICHSLFMVFATWHLGVRYAARANERSIRFAVAGMLFVLPWIIAAIFAGMGPPPFVISGWAVLADEQRIRFGILVVCGISLAGACSLVSALARERGEFLYSRLATTFIVIAVPVFFVVMAFWGAVFTDAAVAMAKTNSTERPDWLGPIRHLADFLTVTEVCLFYLCTAAMAISFRKLNWLPVRSCNAYFVVSLIAVAANLLPNSVPEPLVILNYVAGIPAATMIMPYLMGLTLLRRIETLT